MEKAAGVRPLLSPPVVLRTYAPDLLSGYEFVYVKLHGLADQRFWYNAGWDTVVSAEQLRGTDLVGAVVFVANCYLPESPMLAALLDAGAAAVVGGGGPNLAGVNVVQGADLLGFWFRMAYQLMGDAGLALSVAKRRLKVTPNRANRDALEFELWTQKNTN